MYTISNLFVKSLIFPLFQAALYCKSDHFTYIKTLFDFSAAPHLYQTFLPPFIYDKIICSHLHSRLLHLVLFGFSKLTEKVKSKYRPVATISQIEIDAARSGRTCWGVPSPNPAHFALCAFFGCAAYLCGNQGRKPGHDWLSKNSRGLRRVRQQKTQIHEKVQALPGAKKSRTLPPGNALPSIHSFFKSGGPFGADLVLLSSVCLFSVVPLY